MGTGVGSPLTACLKGSEPPEVNDRFRAGSVAAECPREAFVGRFASPGRSRTRSASGITATRFAEASQEWD